MYAVLDAIATGHPPTRGSQAEAAAFMERVERLPTPIRKRLPLIYERSGIDFRQTCVPDYVREPADFEFFAPNWSLDPEPSTRTRNQHYRSVAGPLAEEVGRAALAEAGLAPEEVTHVIAVTCTGFFAPGLDVALIKGLDLRPDVQRVVIGFMGCYAAFNALRVARSFCKADPGARVLVVCVELCTLHFQIQDTLESVIVNSLFSDGAAAAVVSSRAQDEAAGQLAVADTHVLLDGDSADDMTWDICDTGFDMGLSARVPSVIAANLPGYLDALLGRNGLAQADVDFWAIHPGGRAIVEKARDVLRLSDGAVADSLDVLRLHGNMSSPTILFVLKRFLDRHAQRRAGGEPGFRQGVAMAFGPGLTLEGALLQRVPAG